MDTIADMEHGTTTGTTTTSTSGNASGNASGMRRSRVAGDARILVHSEKSGVRLTVYGPLDEEGYQLLAEVARAALVTVKRAHRIHLDLSRVAPEPGRLPRIVQRLVRAGATVTHPVADRLDAGAYGTEIGAAR